MNPSGRPIEDGERLARLRLARSKGIGPITYKSLMTHYGSAIDAIEALPELARRGGRKRRLEPCPTDEARAELERLQEIGAALLTPGEPDYPEALAAIDDPPPAIAVLGRRELLQERMVGIVGTRNASAAGRQFTRALAAELGTAGFVVSSGMARGIDTTAHEGSLASGTVAVLAGGVDVPYPRENAALYERLLAEGAVIAEQPLGTQPTARHFPPRNRMISGLALGVIVVEANLRSGSLITARLANEQGRIVFAVPGFPRDPRAAGPNNLLRQGAILVEGADDVIAGIEGMSRPAAEPVSQTPITGFTEPEEVDETARTRVVNRLSRTPVTVDELVRECQLSAALVRTILLELELAERIERQPGNRVCLVT